MKYSESAGSATVNVQELPDAVICWKLRRGDRSYGVVPEAVARSQKLWRDRRSCGEVLEAVANFLIVAIPQISIRLRPQSESSFFLRLPMATSSIMLLSKH